MLLQTNNGKNHASTSLTADISQYIKFSDSQKLLDVIQIQTAEQITKFWTMWSETLTTQSLNVKELLKIGRGISRSIKKIKDITANASGVSEEVLISDVRNYHLMIMFH